MAVDKYFVASSETSAFTQVRIIGLKPYAISYGGAYSIGSPIYGMSHPPPVRRHPGAPAQFV